MTEYRDTPDDDQHATTPDGGVVPTGDTDGTPATDSGHADGRVPGADQTPVDPSTLRSAYAFDGSGPFLFAADGTGPYAYTSDGRGPFLAEVPTGHHTAPTVAGHGGRRRVGLVVGAGVAALAIVGAAGGTAFGLATRDAGATTSSRSTQSGQAGGGVDGRWTIPGGSGQGGTGGTGSGSAGGSSGSTGTGTGTGTAQTAATAAQERGVVTIVSTLDYDSSSQSAGTGMVMTANGEVLTNNHVVQGATSIQVTVQSTGRTYTADVVGTDATNDVAVLQLRGATGLTTATFDDDGDLAVGDTVTDVGNAAGAGRLVAAAGAVTALDQDITVQSESGTGTESLTGLIEVSADVVSGDSGGPLLDSEGEVVGMTTAASSGSTDVTGYAIPVTTAKRIAQQILSGKATSTVVIGTPAFLGAEVAPTSTTTGSGVTLQGVVPGSPAAAAGLGAGDTITSIDGTAVTAAGQLTDLIRAHAVGSSVSIGYTTAEGTAGSGTATLVAGPAA